jgi:hypothetical protein
MLLPVQGFSRTFIGGARHNMVSAATNPWQRSLTETGLARGAAWALALASLFASSLWAAQAKPLTVLEGKLETKDCPLLKVNGREQALSADTPHLLHTMQDKRLDGREVRLEGTLKPDRSFEVQWFYTLHKGKLFRVRYFCATCNIVALEPGNCVCCQQPTELQEIPKD